MGIQRSYRHVNPHGISNTAEDCACGNRQRSEHGGSILRLAPWLRIQASTVRKQKAPDADAQNEDHDDEEPNLIDRDELDPSEDRKQLNQKI